ncbi:MAG: hypothetical protein EXS50_02000 [Candidatus Taylorbacteria bacterium]|nr:hypothetical protein [Candidatus Taylorbacteria bacterium]
MSNSFKGFLKVFKNVRYSIGAVFFMFCAYFILVVVPQYSTIGFFWSLPVSLIRKFYFVFTVACGFLVSTEFLNALYVLFVSLLLGLNISAFVYFYRKVRGGFDAKSAGAGLGGGFIAFLGAGCASCGTFIATYALGLIGGQGLLLWLPLGGREFAIVGIFGLLASLYMVCRRV